MEKLGKKINVLLFSALVLFFIFVHDTMAFLVCIRHSIYFHQLFYFMLLSSQQEDCEKAYFKMDNVLIDDRRIHVDFSQSVAKIKWKGKGTCSEFFVAFFF